MFRTLRSKILTSYLAIILLMGCLLTWSILSLIQIENQGRNELQNRLRVLTLIDSFDQSVTGLRANALRLIYNPNSTDDPQLLTRSGEQLQSTVELVTKRIAQVDPSLSQNYELAQLAYLSRVLIQELRFTIAPTIDGREVSTRERLESFSTEIEPIIDSIRSNVRAIEHDYTVSLDQAALDVVDNGSRVRNQVMIFGLIVVTLCIYLSLKFANGIVAPIAELTEKSRLITAGELHQLVIPRTNDELGRLGDQFNLMAEKLTEFEELNLKKILEEKAISESIVQAMDDALILIDRLGYILSVNRKAEAIFKFRGVEGLRCVDVSKGVPVVETLCVAAVNNTWDVELGLKVVEHNADNETVYLTRDIIPIQSGY
jgi:PAS domain-containing protein